MVRGRRTRKAASTLTTTTTTSNGTPLSPIRGGAGSGSAVGKMNSPLAQQNGYKMASKGNVVLVDDYCCASPKRKEYKIDELLRKNGATVTNGFTSGDNGQPLDLTATKGKMVLRGSQNHVNGTQTNGRLCPVAGNEITRFLLSQSKSKSRKARKKSPNFELVNDDTCDSFTHATTLQEQNESSSGGAGAGGVTVKMEAEDGQDMEQKTNGVQMFQMFGRLPIGAGIVDEENIFLQEPVLKLAVDEAACVLVQPKSSGGENNQNGERRKANGAVAVALINQDSNSGDSGVVIDKLQEQAASATGQQMAPPTVTPKAPLLAVSRQRKPTTPHRILCPSSPQNHAQKEEAVTVEEIGRNGEGDDGEDYQMTKRELLLPSKDDDGEELADGAKMTATLNGTKKAEQSSAATMKAPKAKTMAAATTTNGHHHHQSTMEDFFKVRRSVRKTKKEVEREEQLAIEKAILGACDLGLAVKMFENKGRGIVATRPFARGEFVVEYVGEFISIAEANKREKVYAEDQSTGCYMYYFRHKNKQFCIDATEETGKLGRLVNHSRNGNLMTRTVEVNGQPHLVLIAKEDIEEGKELTYDYGDRSKEALLHHPWLAF